MNGEHKTGGGTVAAPAATDDEKLLRLPQVLATVGIGRTAWLDMVKSGAAPAPVNIGRAVAWPMSEIQGFIRERIRQSRGAR